MLKLPKASILVGASYQLSFASAIKRAMKDSLMVGTVGLITDATQAEINLVNGDADFIFIARELLRDPYGFFELILTTFVITTKTTACYLY